MEEMRLNAEEAASRLDKYLAQALPVSRTQLTNAIRDGNVTVNGAPAKPGDKVKSGDEIVVRLPDPEPAELAAEDIPLDIVYQDNDIAVVNKPQGMVVHPAPGHATGTLAGGLLSALDNLSGVGGQMRPGIYGLIGPGTYPLHLGMQCLQSNDDVCLYYGYVYPPLTAMQRLTAYGLNMPVTQLLVDPRVILTRGQSFSSFRLRMRFMNFVDMFETLPTPTISIERLLADVSNVREKEDQLVVICLDDFAAWLRTSLTALGPEGGDPQRLAHSNT
jgi:hypothetical protein